MTYFNITQTDKNYVFPFVDDGSLVVVNNETTQSKVLFSCQQFVVVQVQHISGTYNLLYTTDTFGKIVSTDFHNLQPDVQERLLELWNNLKEAQAEPSD